jgi:putative PIN family toxin of toxin-antitoxin system
MDKPDIVIDTNVIVSALRSKRGASSRLMKLIGAGLFDIHLSVPLILEYEDALLRQNQSLSITQEVVADLIDSICALGKLHEIYFLWCPYLRDRNDEFVLELAVAAR